MSTPTPAETIDFRDFFAAATGRRHLPYGWQCRLACGDDASQDASGTLRKGTFCESRLIDIPTGLGKTAGVALAWLFNRVYVQREDWPRRLIYCLPMRTLVEQTADEVRDWVKQLINSGHIPINYADGLPRVIVLMGGEALDGDEKGWDLYPEQNAIIIGTQDMLLSRALNRGYGMSRYRWPMHFALLNNDCLWVMDEVQLMGSGLWTSAQLDWMREQRFKLQFPVKTWWMSATLGGSFLETSDRKREEMPVPDPIFRLTSEEETALPILEARRPLEWLSLEATVKKTTKKRTKANVDATSVYDRLAAHVADQHQDGTLSLVICNRVAHAQDTLNALQQILERQGKQVAVELLTSRFRPSDRQAKLDVVLAFESARKAGEAHPGLILVSTQVIEAGFDVSATRLWTQLAPGHRSSSVSVGSIATGSPTRLPRPWSSTFTVPRTT